MNQSIDLAQQALQHPPSDLKDLLNDPRVPKAAMESIKAEGFRPEKKDKDGAQDEGRRVGAGAEAGAGAMAGVSGLGDGRLQVVNEKQEFR
jgi:hypothetical protein